MFSAISYFFVLQLEVIIIFTLDSNLMASLVGLAGSAIGSLCGVLINTKLSNYRIEQLEKKVDRHNNLIERVYKLEENDAVVKQQIKVNDHRIDDLEEIISNAKQH